MAEEEGAAVVALLEELRAAEKEQSLVYRSIAARAEAEGLPDLAQRFHDLHADEQHHLSRLTARVLELGGRPADLSGARADHRPLAEWEATIRAREAAEITRYRRALDQDLDEGSRAVVEEILSVEETHSEQLGGKWTVA